MTRYSGHSQIGSVANLAITLTHPCCSLALPRERRLKTHPTAAQSVANGFSEESVNGSGSKARNPHEHPQKNHFKTDFSRVPSSIPKSSLC